MRQAVTTFEKFSTECLSLLREHYPCWGKGLDNQSLVVDGHGETVFGVVLSSFLVVEQGRGQSEQVPAGWVFSFRAPAKFHAQGRTMLFGRPGFVGRDCMARLQDQATLSYMDGSGCSVAVFPPRQGDPMMHQVFMPKATTQKPHIHPSSRIGIVTKGCIIMESAHEQVHLEPGGVFVVPPRVLHGMATKDFEGEAVVFHPEGGWGPTDELNPMLMRTLNGR